ncbi:MAG: ABC transporter ATP-binding protein [Candidatus Thorarchaeota archaeon]
MTKLELKEISMKYERKYILDELVLDVNHGELLVLLGESGCGKTTLLKIIAGIIEPEKGDIIMDGDNITHLAPQKRKIGYVPQTQVLFPHMKIRENISFGLEAHKFEKEEIENKIKWVAKLTQIEELLDRYPSEISGGQKQRVALGRAMAIEPHLLLLDEPLSSIDASGRESLALTIRRIQKETETTTLYVTHNQEEARLICDRVAVMYNGKIQQIGKVIEIDKHPLNFIIAKIMGSINVWPIEFIETKDKKSILTTPIGNLHLPYEINQKPSGIKIPMEVLKLSFEKRSKDQHLDASDIILNGRIKSIVEKNEETLRIIVDLTKTASEYIKVDCKKELIKEELKANQEVSLYIDPLEVVLI